VPSSCTHSALTLPVTPPPTEFQVVPFHMAMPAEAAPPAVVKSPPT
jgi:hypothetical protein